MLFDTVFATGAGVAMPAFADGAGEVTAGVVTLFVAGALTVPLFVDTACCFLVGVGVGVVESAHTLVTANNNAAAHALTNFVF